MPYSLNLVHPNRQSPFPPDISASLPSAWALPPSSPDRSVTVRVVPVKIESRSVAYDFRLRSYPLSHHHASAASSCPPRCPCSLRWNERRWYRWCCPFSCWTSLPDSLWVFGLLCCSVPCDTSLKRKKPDRVCVGNEVRQRASKNLEHSPIWLLSCFCFFLWFLRCFRCQTS